MRAAWTPPCSPPTRPAPRRVACWRCRAGAAGAGRAGPRGRAGARPGGVAARPRRGARRAARRRASRRRSIEQSAAAGGGAVALPRRGRRAAGADARTATPAASPRAATCRRTRCPDALLVFFHGGGWVQPLRRAATTRRSAASPTCPASRIVSVDYRRAPEHPFPAAADDALAAYRALCRR